MMVLMIYTGCRLGEALHLRWEWIDFKAMRIFVRDWRKLPGANPLFALKFKKERIIPLQPELSKLIKKIAQHQGWVVPDKLRMSSSRGHLSRFKTYVQKVLGGRADAEGNDIDVVGDRSPHSCRHCYIALSLATGENDTLVQIYAGHRQLTTTATYGRSQVEYREIAKKWQPGIFQLLARKKAKRKTKPEIVETAASALVRVDSGESAGAAIA
jgi:integrase